MPPKVSVIFFRIYDLLNVPRLWTVKDENYQFSSFSNPDKMFGKMSSVLQNLEEAAVKKKKKNRRRAVCNMRS